MPKSCICYCAHPHTYLKWFSSSDWIAPCWLPSAMRTDSVPRNMWSLCNRIFGRISVNVFLVQVHFEDSLYIRFDDTDFIRKSKVLVDWVTREESTVLGGTVCAVSVTNKRTLNSISAPKHFSKFSFVWCKIHFCIALGFCKINSWKHPGNLCSICVYTSFLFQPWK
jgi:hypothetical protein